MRRHVFVPIAGVIAASFAFAQPAFAATATNDEFANATPITALPFSDVVNTAGTTIEPGEPQPCNYLSQSVWYTITPGVDEVLKADTAGTGFVTGLNVYKSSSPGLGGLSFLGCSTNPNPVIFAATGGTSYYLQAGILYGATGDLHVNVAAVPPPANDNFSSATRIPSLPFSDTVDTSAATLETAEPTPSCGYGPMAGSVWYAFTPTTSESVTASANPYYQAQVAAYTGSSLASLTDLGCRTGGSVLTIHVNAGQSYYFQFGGTFGQRGLLTFSLAVTLPPVVNFNYYPSDPSVFDTIQFNDYSYDPGQLGIQSQSWSFGDGASATGCCPTHRYAADGNYSLKHTVTTPDGRSATATQIVVVKTHDVAIRSFSVPNSAHAGQIRSITVGVSNHRYPETVQVQLLKSVPGPYNNFQVVGTLTLQVLPGNRTASFDFSYSFTTDDAAVGKVTFEAVASVLGARDAAPADNTAISLPTRVS